MTYSRNNNKKLTVTNCSQFRLLRDDAGEPLFQCCNFIIEICLEKKFLMPEIFSIRLFILTTLYCQTFGGLLYRYYIKCTDVCCIRIYCKDML